jgi:hypothetical protein
VACDFEAAARRDLVAGELGLARSDHAAAAAPSPVAVHVAGTVDDAEMMLDVLVGHERGGAVKRRRALAETEEEAPGAGAADGVSAVRRR